MHISAKCSVAAHCLIFINEYGSKAKVTSELLAASTGCNPVTVRNILSALKKEGIIGIKPGTGGASLCLKPAEISLYRIYQAVDPDSLEKFIGIHSSPSPLCPVGRNIDSVLRKAYLPAREALTVSLDSVSLESLIEDFHNDLKEEEGAGA